MSKATDTIHLVLIERIKLVQEGKKPGIQLYLGEKPGISILRAKVRKHTAKLEQIGIERTP